jgi:hypothetical protein
VGRKVRDQTPGDRETLSPGHCLGDGDGGHGGEHPFPTLAGLGIVFDVETILQTIELFSRRNDGFIKSTAVRGNFVVAAT